FCYVHSASFIYTLSLHDALPIFVPRKLKRSSQARPPHAWHAAGAPFCCKKYGKDSALLLAFSMQLCYAFRRKNDRNEEEICAREDRKSTRLNSSHVSISYAVFCF